MLLFEKQNEELASILGLVERKSRLQVARQRVFRSVDKLVVHYLNSVGRTSTEDRVRGCEDAWRGLRCAVDDLIKVSSREM